MQRIELKESITVEFKSDKNCLGDNEIIDAVVAFANTDGGDLYLGIEDDGEITGLHKNHMDITRLSAFIANKTVPPVSVRTEILDLSLPVLKISIPKRTSIVASSSGKIQRRRIKSDGTPENVPMYPYEISSRLSSLNLLDYSAQPVPDCDYSELDPLERQRLRNNISLYRGETSLLELSDLDLDKALRLVTTEGDKIVPTFCGLLIIGKKEAIIKHMPTAEASIQILEGTDIRVNDTFILPILQAFEKIQQRFTAYNTIEEIDVDFRSIKIPSYDPRAFREALVNAFCHRDYSMLGRVRVYINDEGMTISNPGGFVEGISVNNLVDAEPHGRNDVLADALKRIGLAERTGRGIDRILEGSVLNGRDVPDYSKSTNNRVQVFIPNGSVDIPFIKMLIEKQKETGKQFTIYNLLVLNTLKNIPRSTVKEVSVFAKLDEYRTRITLEDLVSSGIIEYDGEGKGKHYMLCSDYYKMTGKNNNYCRNKNIDLSRYSEIIMQMAEKNEYISRKDIAQLLHITSSQAYRILNKLKNSGKLISYGKGAGTKYKINR